MPYRKRWMYQDYQYVGDYTVKDKLIAVGTVAAVIAGIVWLVFA